MNKFTLPTAALGLVALLSSVLLQGGTKEDTAALRSQIADAQARLAAIGASNHTQAAHAAGVAERDAADASADRADARDTARAVASDASEANIQAVITAAANRAETEALLKVSDRNNFAIYATLITSVFGFLSMIAGFFWKAFQDKRNHEWQLEAINAGRTEAKIAYTEANDVNNKIAAIGLQTKDGTPLNPAAH